MQLGDEAERLARNGARDVALALLMDRLAQQDGEAALTLAHWRVTGQWIDRDLSVARELFGRAVEWGCAAAELPLIALMASGAGGQTRAWGDALTRFESLGRADPLIARQCELIAQMAIDATGDPVSGYTPDFLSQDPLVVRFGAFMTPEECATLAALAKPHLAPASVVDPVSGTLINDPVRTSSAAAFPFLAETPFIHALNRRIAAASRSQPDQGEPLQVLAYNPGQQYRMHSDAISGALNQRIQTFLVYLTDDFEGGATYFPHGELALRPARGDAICFSNVSADMRPALTARHAGLQVTRGTKIILSKWIRQRPLDLSLSLRA